MTAIYFFDFRVQVYSWKYKKSLRTSIACWFFGEWSRLVTYALRQRDYICGWLAVYFAVNSIYTVGGPFPVTTSTKWLMLQSRLTGVDAVTSQCIGDEMEHRRQLWRLWWRRRHAGAAVGRSDGRPYHVALPSSPPRRPPAHPGLVTAANQRTARWRPAVQCALCGAGKSRRQPACEMMRRRCSPCHNLVDSLHGCQTADYCVAFYLDESVVLIAST